MSLTALPPELVNCVVANISSKTTLRCLARCSRQLYLCTIPHLYRYVKIDEEFGFGDPQDEPLRNLASLLIRRPDLARLVRHFTLHVERPPRARERYLRAVEEREERGERGEHEEPEEPEEPEDSEESEESEVPKESEGPREPEKCEELVSPKLVKVDQAFMNVLNTWNLSSGEEKINCLGQISHTRESYHDLILALLLPALPELEKLVLELHTGFNTNYLEQIMHRAACREKPFDIQPPFEALRVFVHSHSFSSVWSTAFIASFLMLPSIQEISGGFESTWGHYYDDDDDDDDDDGGGSSNCIRSKDKNQIKLKSSSSSLTRLDLSGYELTTTELDHMLQAPKALKTLFYRSCTPAYLKLKDIRHALGPQENCLESLGLDFDEDENPRIFGPMASFVNFDTLKVFKIVAVFLATTDYGTGRNSLINIFPPNLETLHLTRFEASFENILEALEHLLAQDSPKQIPSLKDLILEENDSFGAGPTRLMDALWKGTQENTIERLRSVAAARGVSIEVTKGSPLRVWDTSESDDSTDYGPYGPGRREWETDESDESSEW